MENMKPTIWLCPHRQVTHQEARKMLLYCPPDAGDEYSETLPPCPSCLTCSDYVSTSLLHSFKGQHTLTLRTEVTLLSVSSYTKPIAATRCFSFDRVVLALSKLDLPLCAHLSASDSEVQRHHRYYCFLLEALGQPPEKCVCHPGTWHSRPYGAHFKNCKDCYQGGTCTQFGLIAREKLLDGRPVMCFLLVIFRELGTCMRERKDEIPQAWLMHTSLEFFRHSPAELEKTWKEWVGFMAKRSKRWSDSQNYTHRGSLRRKLNIYWAAIRSSVRHYSKEMEPARLADKNGASEDACAIRRAACRRMRAGE